MESMVDLPVAPIRPRPPFFLDLHWYFLYFSQQMKRVLKNDGQTVGGIPHENPAPGNLYPKKPQPC
jgi:hypothetical protein